MAGGTVEAWLDDKTIAELEALASERGRSPSQIVFVALNDGREAGSPALQGGE